MNNKEFTNLLISYHFLSPIWEHVTNHILSEEVKEDELLKIFTIYFTFICSGSSCITLNKKQLNEHWKKKCEDGLVLSLANIEDNKEKENVETNIKAIYDCGCKAIENVEKIFSLTNIIGPGKMFVIYNNYLYSRKYFKAKEGIKNSINRLFVYKDIDSDSFDVDSIWNNASSKQKEFIQKGMNNNLILCGGPGTGKTTAVFYLLLGLLNINSNYKVYLTAPSGKAASRIKESINEGIEEFIKTQPDNHKYDNPIEILRNAKEYTIHRLLENDNSTNGFKRNSNNQFATNSIFIIDESSMIDICLFNSLLQAIPTNSRVFILGDKYQLPSVESGAVLSDLLACENLKNNIIELNVSHRFKEGSEIFNLAKKVNNGESINNINWRQLQDFEIVEREKGKYPVFYYDSEKSSKEEFENVIKKWANHFYKTNEGDCKNIDFSLDTLKNIYSKIDEARVLCAENEGKLGVNYINQIIKKEVIDTSTTTNIKGFYPGIPLMILENNKAFDLYNGDVGIIVSFNDKEVKDNLYFLIKKDSELYRNNATKVEDKILKLDEFILYPLRLLDLCKVIYAYAITIHKSQGSGYENILVILPKKEGHPLLNRQIVYTGITRTKGPTYIISSDERINEAVKKTEKRFTQIFD